MLKTGIIVAFVTISLSAQAASAPVCGISRKVACPAQCNEGEQASETQKCVFDKELYKKDGKGCIRYEPQCWCKVPCPDMPANLKL